MSRKQSDPEKLYLDAIRASLTGQGVVETPVVESIPPFRTLLRGLLVLAAFILLYACFIAISYDTGAIGHWITGFRPAADWLSAYVPTMYQRLGEVSARSIAIQHILFVGWVTTGIAWLSIAIAFWSLDRDYRDRVRRNVRRMREAGNWAQLNKGVAILALAAGITIWGLLFGFPIPLRRTSTIPLIGFGFALLSLLTCLLATYVVGLVLARRSEARGADGT
jgi:hypothetical protein